MLQNFPKNLMFFATPVYLSLIHIQMCIRDRCMCDLKCICLFRMQFYAFLCVCICLVVQQCLVFNLLCTCRTSMLLFMFVLCLNEVVECNAFMCSIHICLKLCPVWRMQNLFHILTSLICKHQVNQICFVVSVCSVLFVVLYLSLIHIQMCIRDRCRLVYSRMPT